MVVALSLIYLVVGESKLPLFLIVIVDCCNTLFQLRSVVASVESVSVAKNLPPP